MEECNRCDGSGYIMPEEPPMYAVIIDGDGDAWQRRSGGWSCTLHGDDLTRKSWRTMVEDHGYARTVYTP